MNQIGSLGGGGENEFTRTEDGAPEEEVDAALDEAPAAVISSEVGELAASLGLNATPDETSASSAPSALPGLAPPGDDARIVVADPGGFTCRFCSFDRGRKATVTKHEKKEHSDSYIKLAPKKRGAGNDEAPSKKARGLNSEEDV